MENRFNEVETNNLKDILNVLSSAKLPSKAIIMQANDEDIANISKMSRNKFKTVFPNLSTGVPYLSLEKYNEIYESYDSDRKIIEFIDEILREAKMVDCFSIPIKFNKSGNTLVNPLPIYSKLGNICNKMPIIFSEINCSTVVTGAIEGSFIHECVHMLFCRNKKISDKDIKSEFLSIFIEKIILYSFYSSTDPYNFEQMNRWSSSKKLIDEIRSKEDNMAKEYFKSCILAEYFSKYIFEVSFDERMIISDDISLVLDGKLSLDQFLEKYNLSLSNMDCINAAIQSIKDSEKFWDDFKPPIK